MSLRKALRVRKSLSRGFFCVVPSRSSLTFPQRHLGGTTNDARVKELETQLNKTLAVYNNILGKHKYLTGDEISLADLFHLPYGQWARKIGYKETFEKYPNVERWFASLEARESWVKVQ